MKTGYTDSCTLVCFSSQPNVTLKCCSGIDFDFWEIVGWDVKNLKKVGVQIFLLKIGLSFENMAELGTGQ